MVRRSLAVPGRISTHALYMCASRYCCRHSCRHIGGHALWIALTLQSESAALQTTGDNFQPLCRHPAEV